MATQPLSIDPAALRAAFKARCKATNDVYQNWQIRVHRSLSWLMRALDFPDEEVEARFLFLWIALNSLYSRWDGERNAPDQDSHARHDFFLQICRMEPESIASSLRLHRPLVKRLLGDPYLSHVFWRNPDDPKARGRATHDLNYLDHHLKKREYGQVLKQVMDRIFVLRGQLVHGASTRGSRHNRQTLKNATTLLEKLLPVILNTVIEHGCGDDWPELCYPPHAQ